MNFQSVHIIGIGGISMSGIAKILINRGYKVTGSDIKRNDQTELLKKRGADIYIGHQASNIKNPEAVVYTNAVEKDNVELLAAQTKDIKIFKRAEFLSELFKDKETIAVSGTHGKTTTTSMLATIFVNANNDPSVMIGGNLDLIGGNIKNGDGNIFITEADESDGSLIYFDPKYAVLTNIEWDHFNYYKNIDEVINKFTEFIDKIPSDGALILWENILQEFHQFKKYKDIIYSFGFENADYTARNIEMKSYTSYFEIFKNNKKIASINLNVPGRHNILNALAAFAVSKKAGLQTKEIIDGIKKYKGVKRRFEKKGQFNKALIVDDYAHHPTEIINTIKTAKKTDHNKLYVVFQPHRYSRTKNLMKEFSESFDEVDELILTDIYSASEKPIHGVSSKKLYELIKKHKKKNNLNFTVNYIREFVDIKKHLIKHLQSNDLLLTVGAGNVYEIGEDLVGVEHE